MLSLTAFTVRPIFLNKSMKLSKLLHGVPTVSVLVPVAHGSEEMETVTIVDTLVRGGAKVTLAAVNSPSLEVRCSRGVTLLADKFIVDCMTEEWTLIVCPGGMPGAQHLFNCIRLGNILRKQDEAGRYIAAICASPAVILAKGNFCEGLKMTCYPSPTFISLLGERYQPDKVVVDGHLITSQGPATALDFSLKLVELLFGVDKAAQVRREMIA